MHRTEQVVNVSIDGVTHAVAEVETSALLGYTRCRQKFSRYEEEVHGTAKWASLTESEADCMACIAGVGPP